MRKSNLPDVSDKRKSVIGGSNSLAHGKPEKYQLLPELPPEQFEALKASIAERGVIVPVVVDEFGAIIEGHNRARACRELGINDYPVDVRSGLSEVEKRTLARELNVLRRHLSRDQVRALITEQLKDTPDWADRRIGQKLGVDHKTVAEARARLLATGEIPQSDKLLGMDGKERPIRERKPAARKSAADLDPFECDLDDDEDDASVRRQRRRRDDDPWDNPVGVAKMRHAVDLMEMGADPNSEKVVKLLREATFKTPRYDPLAGRSEAKRLEWHLFMLFLSFDQAAGRAGGEPQGVATHVEWILQRGFQNVAEWLGHEGDQFRRRSLGSSPISEQFKSEWAAFLAKHRERELADVVKELETLQKQFEEARAAGRFQSNRNRKRRQSRNSTKYREAAE
jgi:ParB-like chromosome segregation protein Spo0J